MACFRCVTPAKCDIYGCCPGTWPAEVSQAAVRAKLNQWAIERAGYVCRLMRKGATAQTVQYPTGLLMVRATLGSESCDVELPVFERIKAAGWTVCTANMFAPVLTQADAGHPDNVIL